MDIYLLALGWWNLIGCTIMFGFFNENFGKNVLNKWTKIITTEYVLNYWSKFWLVWVIGLNIFFALMNIYSVRWGVEDIKTFIIKLDVIAYLLFVAWAAWGMKTGHCGQGVYSVFFIFLIWITWGILVII